MRVARTEDLTPAVLASIKELNEEAHGHPFGHDWDHALGGTHFVLEQDGVVVCHASVVTRTLEAAGVPLRTGYVEAVATRPDLQRRGFASRIMRAVGEHVAGGFHLGALSTGENDFYARFGWETWPGPTFVRAPDGLRRTASEDGNVMILRTPSTPALDWTAPLSCDWRAGDVW